MAFSDTQDRAQRLRKWLAENDARTLWEQEVPDIGKATCYFIHGCVVIVLRYNQDNSWDLFLTPDISNGIDPTLDNAEQILLGRKAYMVKRGLAQ